MLPVVGTLYWTMLEHDIPVFYAMNASVGVAHGLDLSKNRSSVPGDVNAEGGYTSCCNPGSPCFNETTGAGMWQPSVHSWSFGTPGTQVAEPTVALRTKLKRWVLTGKHP